MNAMSNNSELAQRLFQDRGLDVFLQLLQSPITASELSERLGLNRAKVNFILDTLLKQNYITLHSEKTNGVQVEKCYTSNSKTFQLILGEQSDDGEKLSAILYILDVIKNGLVINLKKHETAQLSMVHARIQPGRADEYLRRLQELQAEFDAENLNADNEENVWYTLAVSLFPGSPSSPNPQEGNP